MSTPNSDPDEPISPEEKKILIALGIKPPTSTLSRKRPIGWERGTIASYYKRSYAVWLKKFLDQILKGGEEIDQRITASNLRLTPASLVVRITQAWMFICDNMDPDGKYSELREKIRVTKEDKIYVVFRWKGISISKVELEAVPRLQIGRPWREELITFIEESEPGQNLQIEGLMLSKEDQDHVRLLCGQGDLLVDLISKTRIKVTCQDPNLEPTIGVPTDAVNIQELKDTLGNE